MEKRAILAIILTFVIIMLWSFIQAKFFPTPPPKETKKEVSAPAEKVTEQAPAPPAIKESPKATKEKAVPAEKVVARRDVTVETPNYSAVFTNDGAKLVHFRLKHFESGIEQSPLAVKIVQLIDGLLGNKKGEPPKPVPLDLVNTTREEGLPLGLTSGATGLAIPEGNWEVDKDELRLSGTDGKGEVAFSKALPNGLRITKRFKFTGDKYAIDLDLEVENNSSQEVRGPWGLEWVGKVELAKLASQENKDFGLKYALLNDRKVEKKDLGGTSSSGCTPGCSAPRKQVEPFESSYSGDIRWFCFEGEYFAAMLIAQGEGKTAALSVKGDERNILRANFVTPVAVASQQTVRIPYRIYLGPKEIDRLEKLGDEAQKIIDFGYFSVVAKPLLWFMNLTNRVTGNYGLDIILISILIKIVFLPLTQMSMKSMKEMQKVQPEMNRLTEIYKDDKARLQQEIMLLYKRRKINPAGGCLPMLIQIPVFIALYNALQNAIELRHAPFMLWVRDLSAKDPIYITPLVMGATMFMQQKMTPTAADPTQAKLFMFMPIMFTFLFLNLPSGLVLYWLVNNVLSIAHQYYMNKKV